MSTRAWHQRVPGGALRSWSLRPRSPGGQPSLWNVQAPGAPGRPRLPPSDARDRLSGAHPLQPPERVQRPGGQGACSPPHSWEGGVRRDGRGGGGPARVSRRVRNRGTAHRPLGPAGSGGLGSGCSESSSMLNVLLFLPDRPALSGRLRTSQHSQSPGPSPEFRPVSGGRTQASAALGGERCSGTTVYTPPTLSMAQEPTQEPQEPAL